MIIIVVIICDVITSQPFLVSALILIFFIHPHARRRICNFTMQSYIELIFMHMLTKSHFQVLLWSFQKSNNSIYRLLQNCN